MKKILQLFFFVLFLFTSSQALAQVELDVKTKFSEKVELTVIKHGILKSINVTDWLTVTEIGEDYSLWIKNLSKKAENDSIAVYVNIELRTPSMFNEGDLVKSWKLRTVYKPNMVKDNMSVKLLGDFISREAGETLKVINIASSLMSVVPGSYIFLNKIIEGVLRESDQKPTTTQLLVGTLVGSKVIIKLNRYFNK